MAHDLEALVDELLQSVGQLRRRLRAEATGDELTLSQAAVIGRLFRDGAATTADLARAEGVKPQSMGATLAALEQQELVVREPHPSDGRQYLYALTPAGIQARERRRLLKRAWLTAALANLGSDEITALGTALRVIRGLGEH